MALARYDERLSAHRERLPDAGDWLMAKACRKAAVEVSGSSAYMYGVSAHRVSPAKPTHPGRDSWLDSAEYSQATRIVATTSWDMQAVLGLIPGESCGYTGESTADCTGASIDRMSHLSLAR